MYSSLETDPNPLRYSNEKNEASQRKDLLSNIKLSDNLLLKIFSNLSSLVDLSRIGRVCKRWQKVQLLPDFWHNATQHPSFLLEIFKKKNEIFYPLLMNNPPKQVLFPLLPEQVALEVENLLTEPFDIVPLYPDIYPKGETTIKALTNILIEEINTKLPQILIQNVKIIGGIANARLEEYWKVFFTYLGVDEAKTRSLFSFQSKKTNESLLKERNDCDIVLDLQIQHLDDMDKLKALLITVIQNVVKNIDFGIAKQYYFSDLAVINEEKNIFLIAKIGDRNGKTIEFKLCVKQVYQHLFPQDGFAISFFNYLKTNKKEDFAVNCLSNKPFTTIFYHQTGQLWLHNLKEANKKVFPRFLLHLTLNKETPQPNLCKTLSDKFHENSPSQKSKMELLKECLEGHCTGDQSAAIIFYLNAYTLGNFKQKGKSFLLKELAKIASSSEMSSFLKTLHSIILSTSPEAIPDLLITLQLCALLYYSRQRGEWDKTHHLTVVKTQLEGKAYLKILLKGKGNTFYALWTPYFFIWENLKNRLKHPHFTKLYFFFNPDWTTCLQKAPSHSIFSKRLIDEEIFPACERHLFSNQILLCQVGLDLLFNIKVASAELDFSGSLIKKIPHLLPLYKEHHQEDSLFNILTLLLFPSLKAQTFKNLREWVNQTRRLDTDFFFSLLTDLIDTEAEGLKKLVITQWIQSLEQYPITFSPEIAAKISKLIQALVNIHPEQVLFLFNHYLKELWLSHPNLMALNLLALSQAYDNKKLSQEALYPLLSLLGKNEKTLSVNELNQISHSFGRLTRQCIEQNVDKGKILVKHLMQQEWLQAGSIELEEALLCLVEIGLNSPLTKDIKQTLSIWEKFLISKSSVHYLDRQKMLAYQLLDKVKAKKIDNFSISDLNPLKPLLLDLPEFLTKLSIVPIKSLVEANQFQAAATQLTQSIQSSQIEFDQELYFLILNGLIQTENFDFVLTWLATLLPLLQLESVIYARTLVTYAVQKLLASTPSITKIGQAWKLLKQQAEKLELFKETPFEKWKLWHLITQQLITKLKKQVDEKVLIAAWESLLDFTLPALQSVKLIEKEHLAETIQTLIFTLNASTPPEQTKYPNSLKNFSRYLEFFATEALSQDLLSEAQRLFILAYEKGFLSQESFLCESLTLLITEQSLKSKLSDTKEAYEMLKIAHEKGFLKPRQLLERQVLLIKQVFESLLAENQVEEATTLLNILLDPLVGEPHQFTLPTLSWELTEKCLKKEEKCSLQQVTTCYEQGIIKPKEIVEKGKALIRSVKEKIDFSKVIALFLDLKHLLKEQFILKDWHPTLATSITSFLQTVESIKDKEKLQQVSQILREAKLLDPLFANEWKLIVEKWLEIENDQEAWKLFDVLNKQQILDKELKPALFLILLKKTIKQSPEHPLCYFKNTEVLETIIDDQTPQEIQVKNTEALETIIDDQTPKEIQVKIYHFLFLEAVKIKKQLSYFLSNILSKREKLTNLLRDPSYFNARKDIDLALIKALFHKRELKDLLTARNYLSDLLTDIPSEIDNKIKQELESVFSQLITHLRGFQKEDSNIGRIPYTILKLIQKGHEAGLTNVPYLLGARLIIDYEAVNEIYLNRYLYEYALKEAKTPENFELMGKFCSWGLEQNLESLNQLIGNLLTEEKEKNPLMNPHLLKIYVKFRLRKGVLADKTNKFEAVQETVNLFLQNLRKFHYTLDNQEKMDLIILVSKNLIYLLDTSNELVTQHLPLFKGLYQSLLEAIKAFWAKEDLVGYYQEAITIHLTSRSLEREVVNQLSRENFLEQVQFSYSICENLLIRTSKYFLSALEEFAYQILLDEKDETFHLLKKLVTDSKEKELYFKGHKFFFNLLWQIKTGETTSGLADLTNLETEKKRKLTTVTASRLLNTEHPRFLIYGIRLIQLGFPEYIVKDKLGELLLRCFYYDVEKLAPIYKETILYYLANLFCNEKLSNSLGFKEDLPVTLESLQLMPIYFEAFKYLACRTSYIKDFKQVYQQSLKQIYHQCETIIAALIQQNRISEAYRFIYSLIVYGTDFYTHDEFSKEYINFVQSQISKGIQHVNTQLYIQMFSDLISTWSLELQNHNKQEDPSYFEFIQKISILSDKNLV